MGAKSTPSAPDHSRAPRSVASISAPCRVRSASQGSGRHEPSSEGAKRTRPRLSGSARVGIQTLRSIAAPSGPSSSSSAPTFASRSASPRRSGLSGRASTSS
ncbi:MAG TPA: hypothetical protein DEF51_51210 [Myxococcales bacterium]|nr:hypothetical protein [Myxococcales bacterium]